MAFPKVLLPTAGKQFLLFIFKFKSFIWIPQKRLVSHWNKWISSQIKSTCSVTIKVVSKCLLYIRRISLTGQKGHFDLFPIWWKSFSFLLINTKTSKRFLFITFQKATAKRCRCVYFFFLITLEREWRMKLVWFCLLKNFELFQKHWNSFAKVLLQVPSWAVYWCH